MTRYPVYRALYRPLLFAGVPMMYFCLEIVIALLLFVSGLWLLCLPLVIIHAVIAVMLRQDAFYIMILLDVLTFKSKAKEELPRSVSGGRREK